MRCISIAVFLAAITWAQAPPPPRENTAGVWMEKGAAAYRNGRYAEATSIFARAAELAPNDVAAHIALGQTFFSEYIPGDGRPENEALAEAAEREFQLVWRIDPSNVEALEHLGSIALMRASASTDPGGKAARLDEAKDWYERLLGLQPQNRVALYHLGVIAWTKTFPALGQARQQLGMPPSDPGPLTDASLRLSLNARYGAAIEDGIAGLNRALDMNGKDSDAMAYLNLLYRERAALRDTQADARADLAIADDWVRKALELKQQVVEGREGISFSPRMPAAGVPGAAFTMPVLPAAPPPPPPPPPPAQVPGVDAAPPPRIRVSGRVEQANLISKAEPVYPPAGRANGIQGTVRFSAVIAKDGSVGNLQLISGHPLLVEAAMNAVRQYVYKPTLLNGEPVEVATTVDIEFVLDR